MNIKRQYILPNCNLVLEGLEDSDSENVDILNGQSPMSILINAECTFLGSNQTLSGGSIFLTNLSHTVSNYAQSLLSGLSHPQDHHHGDYPRITIQKTSSHLHRLTLIPETSNAETSTEIDLTTIELFDLVDAIDQFHADRNTLPKMNLELKSVSKRYRKPEQPLTERLIPMGIGFASLAFAAGAFFMLPIPEKTPVRTDSIENTTETNPQNSGGNSLPLESNPANNNQTPPSNTGDGSTDSE